MSLVVCSPYWLTIAGVAETESQCLKLFLANQSFGQPAVLDIGTDCVHGVVMRVVVECDHER